jgi:hypothetical protein
LLEVRSVLQTKLYVIKRVADSELLYTLIDRQGNWALSDTVALRILITFDKKHRSVKMTLTKNRFLTTALAASALYLFLYLFLNDLFLYVIGGAFGIVVRIFSKQTNVPLLSFLWVVALAVVTLFYYKFNRWAVKYLFLLLVAVLLYVVDFILYAIMSFDTPHRMIVYLNVAAMVLIKSLVLSLIIRLRDDELTKNLKNYYKY